MITQIGIENKEGPPILDPIYKHQLLKELEPEVLERIKNGFKLYGGSVTISQFIVIMIDVLFQPSNWRKFTKQALTFVELFLLIDLNNLKKIRFEQFTNYLIDRSEEDYSAKEECQFLPATKLNEMQLQAERIFKFEKCNHLGILTNNKKNVEILDKKYYKKVDHLTCGGPLINNIIFIKSYNIYCLASNDKHLSFYQNADHTLVRRFSVPDNFYFLMLFGEDSIKPKLIAASTNGHIHEFSLSKILSVLDKKNKQALKEEQKKIREHPPDKQYRYFSSSRMLDEQTDISCMDVMDALDLLVTGSNDSKVRLYQMRDSGLQFVKDLDGHYKGVKGVSISIHHKLIVSCSFDFDILVWNAYLEHPVARLQGHQAPLMNVECPKSYQIIISLDSKSVMKIWSSENYQLIQNIVIYENFPANTSINFVFKNETNLVMVWTKKVKFYEYVVSYNPKITDDIDITAIKYSPKNLEVYIGSRKNLKVWSVIKGIMTKNYKNVVKSDISIIELDDMERKCFIGTIEGEIVSIDIFSGLLINSYSAHQQEISILMYNNLHKLLISGGWDKRIKIHNDTHHLERIESRQNVMRNINNVSEKDISGGYFSPAQLVIATFSKSNVCKMWDFEKGFLEAQFIVASEISNVLMVDPLPLLIIVDVKGTVYLFSTKYLFKRPYTLLTQWKNMYSIQKSSQITFISSTFSEATSKNPLTCELILGDEYGYVRVVDLASFIEEQDLKPITPQMIGNKNPYRIEDYNYMGTTQNSSNTHDFSQHQTSNIVPPSNIKQIMQIKAHNDRVNYVALIKESAEPLILTAGSDSLVKIWNQKGEPRGVMRQGLKENKSWQYETSRDWCSKQISQYNKVRLEISNTFEEYLFRKRKESVPFAEEDPFETTDNDSIYRHLKEVEKYLDKSSKKSSHRLY